ncbi:MAG: SUMF1/EgtB/PvdO family nonheme iron enzyme [Gammaproteobacteria bacterium]
MAIRPHPTAAPALDGAPSVPLELDIAGAQSIGDREVQEDAFLISHLGDAATLLIVADGMGGHAAGNIASNMAVQSCNRHLCHHHESRDLPALLREAVLEANKTIADMVHETEALRGMGCTLVAVVAHDATLSWASVGDSHLYLVRGGGISKLNADHSYGGFLDRMAALGQPVEPEPGCARNMLMCALTGEEIMEIDCPDPGIRISSGDWLLASSDGLNTLNRDDIIAIAGGASSVRECAERLLQAVAEARVKNQDNTTVVAIRVQTRIPTPRRSMPVAPPIAPAARPDQPLFEPEPRTSPRSGVRWLAGLVVAVILLALVYWLGMGGSETPGPALPEPVATLPETRPEAVPKDRVQENNQKTKGPAIEEAPPEAEPGIAEPTSFRDPLKSGGQGPEMVWLPAGSYDMGSARPGADPDERPRHPVRIDRFAIGRYEVSDAEYGRFARHTGRGLPPIRPSDPNVYPVVSVSWHDALAFTRWLSRETGLRYRLPSEAEWEYAAAAGTTTPYWWGFKVGADEAYCHGCGNHIPRAPRPIGRFKPNPFGLFDSAGNVLEWVQDCYFPAYEGASADGTPREADRCEDRVARGGGFGTPTRSLRTTKRFRFGAAEGYDDVGIRVARDP